eukprot:1929-Pelagococcus_subviridis.AAC.1
MGGERRRGEKSLRNGVHRADAESYGDQCTTERASARASLARAPPSCVAPFESTPPSTATRSTAARRGPSSPRRSQPPARAPSGLGIQAKVGVELKGVRWS